ncbi:MAG: 2,3-bisphosphoglycerate-independent phosphoglycerate mutase [Phycisphaerales bacterium]
MSTRPTSISNTPFVLIIRDGWGLNPNESHAAFDAVRIARERGLTPTADRLMVGCPWTLIKTSGEDVGLPEGTMGNSEVGHQNIGAGRVVDQESVAITKACRAGLETNEAVIGAVNAAKDRSGRVHLMGICSDAGVHGQLSHLYALLAACKALGSPKVYVHLFMDGRDTGPFTGKGYAAQVQAKCEELGVGVVASVIGRYYAMDRDNRWERVERAYACLTGKGESAAKTAIKETAGEAIEAYYASAMTPSQAGDEFVLPTMIGSSKGDAAAGRIRSGDSVIFYNYRGDRPREIIRAFVFDMFEGAVAASPDSGKKGFARDEKLDVHFVTMTSYEEALLPYVHVAFPKAAKMKNIAGEYLSAMGLGQFRCAETEKYPHVTFFFNDYREEAFAGERREIVQSPKVATYDLQPEMSANGVCEAVLRRVNATDGEDVIVVNFANGDMVGHTGNLEAAIKACATVDECVGRIVDATLARGGSLIVTADHGNCEQMYDPETKSPHTAHTVYDVPVIVVGEKWRSAMLRGDREGKGWFDPTVRASRGCLADIFPTALEMMGLGQPAEMTGRSLLKS